MYLCVSETNPGKLAKSSIIQVCYMCVSETNPGKLVKSYTGTLCVCVSDDVCSIHTWWVNVGASGVSEQ